MTTATFCHSVCHGQVTSDVLLPQEMMRRTLLTAIEESDAIPTSGMKPEGEADRRYTTSLENCAQCLCCADGSLAC